MIDGQKHPRGKKKLGSQSKRAMSLIKTNLFTDYKTALALFGVESV